MSTAASHAATPAPSPEPDRRDTAQGRSAGRAWTRWILKRLGLAVLTLWVVSLIVFVATSALGDPVRAILGKDFAVSPERVAQIRAAMHLDESLPQRYWIWLSGLLRGDLGTSIANGVPVSELIGAKVANSAFLVLVVTLIMVPLSLGLAILAARHRGGPIDNAIQVVTLALAGVPEFVTGILLVSLLSTSVFHILPAVTVLPAGAMVWQRPLGLILPVATLVIAVVPYLARILRSTLVETMDSDYVELARLKGIPERLVLRRHALPNTLVPTVQVSALQLAWLVGGVVLVEYLFNFPGIGAALVDAVRNGDFPVVQALAMVIAAVYIVVNLVADALSILLTPRARTEMVA
ncbi:ABC transporter permease [Arsenicicoccus piscis]|uniref:Peptide ABC transporter permease n=1 Tax=Arsenicicoccus piscis TaxID=673954 RepID=A0ABQ6HWH8_9MICO|nr:ABC transporter permease [Arsenicicoccus piscis]MCH8627349.1 ABC transporter permease [Arsenicicoccus piscis]GMA21495.1 peptide ABC transporter permease [Arsenicicoccus piscis]GMA22186.1 peptide ABC transporter permease [Arsenicicoccus piscis]GMA22233.1 peptide ABC transporter permease [Arsenicicoccus piscis]